MSASREEDRLRELFQELRAETESRQQIPDFERMMENVRDEAALRRSVHVFSGDRSLDSAPSRRRQAFAGWASAAVAAGIAALLVTGTGADEDQAFERLVSAYSTDISGGAWVSPTDGLLDVPGFDLLRGVPSVGGSVRGEPGEPISPSPDAGEERL